MDWLVVIFYILVIDSITANYLAWSGKQPWWQKHAPELSQHFPLAKGWTTVYFLMVLYVGIILSKTGLLVLPS